jgi:lysophospholipase L1-like esterase
MKPAVKVLAVQAILVVVLFEIGLRFFNPVVFRVRGDEIVLPINQTYRMTHPGSAKIDPVVTHTKNSLGFRGPDPPRDFASRFTVVTIGGSTTECVNLSDGHTWSDELARQLQQVVPGAWLDNAGIDGQSTFGHIVLLRSVIVKLHPRMAIFLFGANDVGLEQSNTFDAGTLPTPGRLRALRNAIVEHSEVANLLLNLTRAARAHERGFGHSEVDVRKTEDLALEDDYMARVIEQHRVHLPGYAARLHEIAAITKAAGIEAVWLTQPALFGEGKDAATGVDLARLKVNGRGNGVLEWRLLELHNDVTRRVAAEDGVLLIDLARELPKDSRLFYDFLHFTNAGAERVGRIVATHLVAHVREKYGPS